MDTQLDSKTIKPADDEAFRLDFKTITAADMPAIYDILRRSAERAEGVVTPATRTCDYTVGGIYMWIDYFGYEYCIVADTLFIKGRSEANRDITAFSLPVGKLPLEQSVGLLVDYCTAHGLRPVLSAVPAESLDSLLAVSRGTSMELTDWADYLYDIHELATFPGRRFNKKRNHVHRFMANNPHYVFEELTPDLVPEVLMFYDGMAHQEAVAERQETLLPSATEANEAEQCREVLVHLADYPFEGAVLRDEDGAICAFTVGEPLGDTLYVHIEKMDHNVDGSGETICSLFAADMMAQHPELRYANREEDCGDAGLRRAKESYNPLMRLRKFDIAEVALREPVTIPAESSVATPEASGARALRG